MRSLRSKYLLPALLILPASLALPPDADARRVRVTHDSAPADTMRIDTRTLTITDSLTLTSMIRLSGYDKTREASRESLFVSNLGPGTLTSLTLQISYHAPDGRLYHRRSETLKCLIPAGETRLIDFRSWDRQHSFYYIRSRRPARTQATPYEVMILPVRASFEPH